MADQRIVCPHCEQFSLVVPPQYKCEFCHRSLKQEDSQQVAPVPLFASSEEIRGASAANPHDSSPDSGFIAEVTKVENQLLDKVGKAALGWLILHTEERKPVYYEIFEGNNVFGRMGDGYDVDIEIASDTYVSRSHGHIQVEIDLLNRARFTLLDDGSHRIGGRRSTNGTYVNGRTTRLPEDQQIFLEDGDTIQVGETKLVFKLMTEEAENVQVVATQVISSDYTATVVF